MMPDRLRIIDALRGLASLVVCWFHMTNTYPDGSWVKWSSTYAYLGVEVFFVISGFIILYAMHKGGYQLSKDWGRFVVKRIIRLDPPYIATIILILVLWYLSALAPAFQGSSFELDGRQILLHVAYLSGLMGEAWLNPVFWTLAIEFQFYLLLSIIYPLLLSPHKYQRAGILLLLALLAVLIPNDKLVFHYLCLFELGIIGFYFHQNFLTNKEYGFYLLIASILLYITMGFPILCAGLIAILSIRFVTLKINKILLFLGAISYSLYLLHIPIGGRVVNIGKRFVDTDFERFLLSLFALVIAMIAAYVFYRLIEEPAQRWSSSIKY